MPTLRFSFLLALTCLFPSAIVPAISAAEPYWAYGFTNPIPQPAPTPLPPAAALTPVGPPVPSSQLPAEQTRLRHLPSAQAAYSLVQVRDRLDVADWFPEDHPPMSALLRHGPPSLGDRTWGCAYCHMPNGQGRPENAPLAGLPVDYFVRQMRDFRDGHRESSDPRKPNTPIMTALAQGMSDEEFHEAAAYFAAIPYRPWIRVVETEQVPKVKSVSGMFIPLEPLVTEALGLSIREVPEDPEATELLRHPRSGFIAYVPPGSVEKGRQLATMGIAHGAPSGAAPKTVACTACHGPELRGVGDIPGLAGRSPSYLVRQLYDFQTGKRRGVRAAEMAPVTARLDEQDLVFLGAYLASLTP